MTLENSNPTAVPAAGAGNEAQIGQEMVSSLYVKSRKIYAKSVTGFFASWRWALVWITQLIFYGVPWLTWNNRQAILFELDEKRFYIFGLVFYPQDFIYLTGLLVVSAYSLFLFTAVAGRLWCGYACPQTVYTEIFMWIEKKFEGDRIKRMKLDESPWTLEKIWRKTGKNVAWVVLALWTGFTFAGYFTPIKALAAQTLAGALGPWQTFWMLFYSFATWGMAGHMREQVCKYMCPYARFQSAMFDRDTLIISYDSERGEPRGSRSKKADPKKLGLGACVDCGLCVQVCPVGIDIRKGLQYECIGCAACIDVCDGVMDKMGYQRGLVRYVTENGLEKHWDRKMMIRQVLRPRVLIYTAILFLIVGVVSWTIAVRTPFKANIVRDRASLARIVDDGYIENVYRVQLMNASESTETFRMKVEGLPGITLEDAHDVQLAPAEAKWVTIDVRVPPESAQAAGPGVHQIFVNVDRVSDASSGAPSGQSLHEKTTFMIPR